MSKCRRWKRENKLWKPGEAFLDNLPRPPPHCSLKTWYIYSSENEGNLIELNIIQQWWRWWDSRRLNLGNIWRKFGGNWGKRFGSAATLMQKRWLCLTSIWIQMKNQIFFWNFIFFLVFIVFPRYWHYQYILCCLFFEDGRKCFCAKWQAPKLWAIAVAWAQKKWKLYQQHPHQQHHHQHQHPHHQHQHNQHNQQQQQHHHHHYFNDLHSQFLKRQ